MGWGVVVTGASGGVGERTASREVVVDLNQVDAWSPARIDLSGEEGGEGVGSGWWWWVRLRGVGIRDGWFLGGGGGEGEYMS